MGNSGLITKIVNRFDSWMNLLTGLGDPSADKLMQSVPTLVPALADTELEALWRSSDLARRIVASTPDRALKQGFGLQPSSGDIDPEDSQQQIEELLKAVDGFRVIEKMREAWCWGRLYGLGALVMGVDGSGPPEEPLDDERATQLLYLMVVDGRELVPETYYEDALSDKYGEVETYRLKPQSSAASTYAPDEDQGAVIHETRILQFGGALTARRDRHELGGRDFSVLQHVYNVLRQTESNWNGVCYLMTDMAQAVFTINGLSDILSTGNESLLTARMQAVQMGRSVARAVVLDAEKEKFERIATPLGGVPEVLEQTWKRLASAAEMPLTVLMGVSPAGLNATGESDLALWYDTVQTLRERMLGPRLERLVQLISRTIGHADPGGWKITWPSLYQMSSTEKAEHYLKTAQADHIYITDGVLLPEEVGLSRFGQTEFDGAHTKIDVDARNIALQAAIEELKNPAPEPMPGQLPGQLPPGASPPQLSPPGEADQEKLQPEQESAR